MPGRDKSGPMGMGARTGRGFGACAESNRTPGGEGPQTGFFGLGFHSRGGRTGVGKSNRGRFRIPFFSNFSRFGGDPATEKQALEQEVKALQTQLKALQDRLAVMEKPSVPD